MYAGPVVRFQRNKKKFSLELINLNCNGSCIIFNKKKFLILFLSAEYIFSCNGDKNIPSVILIQKQMEKNNMYNK
jgi:hypothetical protein